MGDCQRLIIPHDPKPLAAQLGHEIIARARHACEVPQTVRIKRSSELDPHVSFVDEVAPGAHAVASYQHGSALVARCVEQDFARRNDGFDGVPALKHGLVPVQQPLWCCNIIGVGEFAARHEIHTRPFDQVRVNACG